jgi:hypothetical protein
LHKNNNFSFDVIRRIIQKVSNMEEEAEHILNKICKFNCVKHEFVIFEYLMRLNNNYYKPKEQFGRFNEDVSNTEFMNYILVEQGNILAMSNRLLNEFGLTTKEAEAYQIRDIVNE